MDARLRLALASAARSNSSSSSSSSSSLSAGSRTDDVSSEVEAENQHIISSLFACLSSTKSANNASRPDSLAIPYATADDGNVYSSSGGGEEEEEDGAVDYDDEESQLSSVTLDPILQMTVNVSGNSHRNAQHHATSSTTRHLRFESPTPGLSILTSTSILVNGLVYAGFELDRQEKNNTRRKIDWFKSFYGVEPSTLLPFFLDLKDEYPDICYKNCLMTMNWLYLYDTYPVLSGRWKYCEEYIGENVIKYGKMMAHIGRRKVVFELKDDVELGRTVDCCTFMIHEMRLDPSSQWFDWKVRVVLVLPLSFIFLPFSRSPIIPCLDSFVWTEV